MPVASYGRPLVGTNNSAHTVSSETTTFRLSYSPSPVAGAIYAQPRIVLRWDTSKGKLAVEVSGLGAALLERLRTANLTTAAWQRLLSVYAQPNAASTVPAMLGAYTVTGRSLRFEAAFPAEPGMIYRAAFRPVNLPGAPKGAEVASVFRTPARKSVSTTVVTRIYPTADVLPENLLKFYVHFSAPMSRGHIYDHIRLLDEAGKPVELPFLEIDEELWDPAMKRLTLFIDPGRIKRGVKPLEDIGPALESGKRYTLAIGRTWKDGDGVPLKEGYRKEFRVGPPDREPPDPDQWKLQSPAAGSRAPLTIAFPEPMDQALSQRFLRVVDADGKPLTGTVAFGDGERKWGFTPTQPWRKGSYRLVVRVALEDLAGNNIGKPFDVDLFESIEKHISNSTITLPFEVK